MKRELLQNAEPCHKCGKKTRWVTHATMGCHAASFRQCKSCHTDFNAVLTSGGVHYTERRV